MIADRPTVFGAFAGMDLVPPICGRRRPNPTSRKFPRPNHLIVSVKANHWPSHRGGCEPDSFDQDLRVGLKGDIDEAKRGVTRRRP